MKNHIPSQISVVVVARNAEHVIKACMTSLAQQNLTPAQVILVDDGSTDATVEIANKAYPGLKVLSSPTRSISRNRNLGWEAAETEFVAFLDADCEAPAHWLETLLEAAEQNTAAAIGGGNVPPMGQSVHYDALAIMLDSVLGSRGSLQGKVPTAQAEVSHIPTLNVLYRKDALRSVGGFDPRFARMGEDEDLSRRLRDMGHTLIAIPNAVVVHHQRADLGSWAKNMFGYGKGRTWLIRRHPNAWSPVFLLPPLAVLVWPVYLICIAILSLVLATKAKRPELWLRLAGLLVATHLPYGLGQIFGLFRHGDNELSCTRRKRVGMIALKNAGNKGDEAIICSVSGRLTEMLSQSGRDIDPYLIAFGPSGLDVRPFPVDADAREKVILQMLAPAETSRSVRPFDLITDALRSIVVFSGFKGIFIAGGQWLHDLSLPKHIIVCSLFAFGRLFRTQTGVFCIGVGPLKRAMSRRLVRLGFGRKSLVVTRDDASTSLLHDCGLDHAVTASDPALLLPTSPVEAPKARILISPCAWANFENLYAQDQDQISSSLSNWSRLVAKLKSDGFDLAMLPTMNPEDRAFAEKIASSAGEDIECIATEHLPPSQIQGHIAASSALISMRLHPVIFASNCGTPFVALNYAAKVRAFCEKAECADRVVELNQIDWAQEVMRVLETQTTHPASVSAARSAQIDALTHGYELLDNWLSSFDSSPTPKQQEEPGSCA